MSIKTLLFSFQGRVGRKVFWIWNIAYYACVMGLSVGVAKLFPAFAGIIIVVLLSLLLVPDLAITAKRWHDRGKSSWFLLCNIPLILGRVMVPPGMPGAEMGQPDTVQVVVSLLALVCGAWIFVQCGLLKGDEADNRYGPPQV